MLSAGLSPTSSSAPRERSGDDATASAPGSQAPLQRRLKKRGVEILLRLLPRIYVAYLRFVERTSHVDARDLAEVLDNRAPGDHIAFALLHQDVLALPWFFRGRGVTALAQKTDAGDIITAILEHIGFIAARGGTSASAKRRVPVLQKMIKDAVESTGGSVVAITPDGSSGPAGVVRPGIAYFALRTGATIYCVKLIAARAVFAPTWDRMQIPLPFNRIRVRVSQPLPAPTDNVTLADFERFRAEVERRLHGLHYRAFAEVGRRPVPILKRLADVEAAERATRARRTGLAVLSLSLVAALSGTACRRTDAGGQLVQTADVVYANRISRDGATMLYPRRSFAGETRMPCPAPQSAPQLSGVQVTLDTIVSPGTSMEFAFGVKANEIRGEFEFIATVVGERASRVEKHYVLDGSPGREYGHWHEATLDLGGMRGRVSVELASVATRVPEPDDSGAPAARPFFSCPIFIPPSRNAARPNVILISVDTLRADRLGLYGYNGGTSPKLDARFSRDGIVVDKAYSQASNTLRGHTAMLTGLNPTIAIHKDPAPAMLRGFPTLADHLRRHGYQTAAFTEDAYVSVAYGMAQGFDIFREQKSPTVASGEIERTFQSALGWVGTHTRQPIFLFVHTYEVHTPYDPPQTYRREAAPADAAPATADSLLYDGEIAYMDAQLDKFLNELDRLGVLDHALVVVTADHGEEFGEHGGRYHGAHLYDEIVHVPMLILAPGLLPAGVRRPGPAALVDLLPTVLDVVGAPIPEYLTGVSLLPHLSSGVPLPSRAIASEAYSPRAITVNGMDPNWLPPTLALTRFPYRVIRVRTSTGARNEAYDLIADPDETSNILASGEPVPDIVTEMIDDLARYEETSEQEAARIARSAGVKEASPPRDTEEVGTPNLDRLRALGYVE